ncbi:hypothetical protein E6H16_10690 [Candidatus Bathyarchaeota archaeon]|nr:MAG: hypothetical protein E6H16_10690 [Candidatus Bathyarchaeota archaeon]
MSKEEVYAITVRLDAILRAILDFQRKSEGVKVGDQILVLQDVGLSQTDAGRILGVPGNQVPSYVRGADNKKLKEKLAKQRPMTNKHSGQTRVQVSKEE